MSTLRARGRVWLQGGEGLGRLAAWEVWSALQRSQGQLVVSFRVSLQMYLYGHLLGEKKGQHKKRKYYLSGNLPCSKATGQLVNCLFPTP